MDLTLPRTYLSYSAIHLWCKSKEQFRARYYRNEKLPDTPYTIFGKEIHEKLESDEELQHIPRLDKSEIKLDTKVEGVPILGYIDGFCSNTLDFLDYKSSIRNADGSSKWNELEVLKLDQLPFYSLLIHENYSNAPKDHLSKLIWLETQWKEDDSLLTNPELELTSHHEVFERVIEEWERERIKSWIVENAKEISEDYKNYLA